jgi:hypothetical protein
MTGRLSRRCEAQPRRGTKGRREQKGAFVCVGAAVLHAARPAERADVGHTIERMNSIYDCKHVKAKV